MSLLGHLHLFVEQGYSHNRAWGGTLKIQNLLKVQFCFWVGTTSYKLLWLRPSRYILP